MKYRILKIIVCCFSIAATSQVFANDIVYKNYDMLFNGNFELGNWSWFTLGGVDISSFAAKDGSYGLRVENHKHAFQHLPIPSRIESVTIRFSYRANRGIFSTDNPGKFYVSIGKTAIPEDDNFDQEYYLKGIGGDILEERIDQDFIAQFADNDNDQYGTTRTNWIDFEKKLSQSLINEMQIARDNGELLFLVIQHIPDDKTISGNYSNDIDDISLIINGVQHVPQMTGKIAYIEQWDEQGGSSDKDPHAINLLDPNTRTEQNIWTHPGNTILPWSDLTWRPDATEIAFVSDHEILSSVFRSDIYAIKPDGSDMRKVTGGPSQEEIERGNYPRVTVKGKILNRIDDTDLASSPSFLIVGAHYSKEHYVFNSDDSSSDSFVIPNVPVLDDPKIFDQTIIIHYSNKSCTYGIQYWSVSEVINNGVVDVGTIPLLGIGCMNMAGDYVPRDISWKSDGSEIAYKMQTLFKKVSSKSSKVWDFVEVKPGGGLSGSGLQWSPTDENIYIWAQWNLGNKDKIMMAEEGGEERVLVDGEVNPYVKPAWVPDGSGFVYVGETFRSWDAIYHYDIASGEKTRLTFAPNDRIINVSVAPNGRHIVFERHENILSDNSDLWIIDRLNPANMWRVTHSQNCTSPNWSPKEVTMPSKSSKNLLLTIPAIIAGRVK